MNRFRRTQLIDYCFCLSFSFSFVLFAEPSPVALAVVAEPSAVASVGAVYPSLVASAVASEPFVLAGDPSLVGAAAVAETSAVASVGVAEPFYFFHSDGVSQWHDDNVHVSHHHAVLDDTIPAYSNSVLYPTFSNCCDSHDKKCVCNVQGIA